MAHRPLFIPFDHTPYVQSLSIEFQWHAGLSRAQRKRSIESMHNAIQKANWPGQILEISSASEQEFGQQLSAMNLMVTLDRNGNTITQSVESIYQSAKVFGQVGPHPEWLELTGKQCKKAVQQISKKHGSVTGFEWNGRTWPATNIEGFYSWVYIQGLIQLENGLERLNEYSGFTDIYFNPRKTINCQARTAAQAVQLYKLNLINGIIETPDSFLEFCATNPSGHIGRL